MSRLSASRLAALAAVFLLLWLGGRYLLPLLLPFFLGTGIALMAEPLVRIASRQVPRSLAAGLGEKQAGNMTKDSKKLREIISGLKESDIKAVMDLVGEENFMQILKGTKDNPNG